MISKKQIYKRAREKHSNNGKIIKALDTVFNTQYPKNTKLIILIIDFLKLMIGIPYGHISMCMDRVVDCAELPRIAFYIFLGKDIGSNTDAQFLNKEGVLNGNDYSDLPKADILNLIFYKTSKSKKTGHVSIKIDNNNIIQSGAKDHNYKVGISNLFWGKGTYKLMGIKSFLSEEEMNYKIEDMEEYTEMKKGDKNENVGKLQSMLIKLGFDLPKYGVDNDFGSETESAIKGLQNYYDIPVTGEVDDNTIGLLCSLVSSNSVDTRITDNIRKAIDILSSSL